MKATLIPAETLRAFDNFKVTHTAQVDKLIADGRTLQEVVDILGAQTAFGWNRAVAKLNKSHDALRGEG